MKIFTAAPMPFLQKNVTVAAHFARDMGLTCHALRELGVESMEVLLKGPDDQPHPDVIRATIDEMRDAEWWRQFQLDGVVLGAGAAPKHIQIARAIKQSGAKLIVRCDVGGPYSQLQKGVCRSFYDNYLGPRYQGRGFLYAALYAMAKTPIYYIPSVYEKKVIEHMAYADLILNETPEGVRCLKERLRRFGRTDIAAKVLYAPHPIAGDMRHLQHVRKENRIVAVGRWENYQKNTPLLIRSLGKVLEEHIDYEAHVFGGGETSAQQVAEDFPENVKRRLHIHGRAENAALAAEYQRSRIFFAPSRSESFNIAGAEALSCGCSFVGSGHVLSFRNFVSKNSGTLAGIYSVSGMTDALKTEILAWNKGLRDPVGFSAKWNAEVSRLAVAGQIVAAVHRESRQESGSNETFDDEKN